ncbi:MAG: PIG-L family deacetylase [Spirochaetota bacterium]
MKSNIRSLRNKRSFLTGKPGWKSRLCALGFIIVPLFCLYAESDVLSAADEPAGAGPHYFFLVDTSYSMGLRMPLHSNTQWQLAVEGLSGYLEQIDGRYALAEFSDTDTFKLVVPFTSSKSRIEASLQEPLFWEATDVHDAVEHAVDYVNSAKLSGDAEVKIVVIGDGIETRGSLFSLPRPKSGVSIEIIPVSLPFNAGFETRFANWALTDPYERLLPLARRSDSIVYTSESLLYYTPHSRSSWNILFIVLSVSVVFGPLCVLCIRRAAAAGSKTARQHQSSQTESAEPRYMLHFILYSRQEGYQERRIEFYGIGDEIPLKIGQSGFSQADKNNCQAVISFEEEGCFLSSDVPLLINGVAVRRRRFRPGITIMFGATRLKLLGIERIPAQPRGAESQRGVKPAGRGAMGRAAGAGTVQACLQTLLPVWAAGVLVVGGLYAAATLIEAKGGSPRYTSTARLEFSPYDWETEFLHPVYYRTAGSAQAAASKAENESVKMIRGRRTDGKWQFPELEAERPVDYLFLHAHPDDEALDFGGLLARLEQSGKRVAVALFTDGEAGLSRGPERMNASAPDVLKSIRIEEAAESLRILGADLYIRLGLRNHPYSSQRQVLPIERVFAAWGGLESIEAAVVTLIERLKPEVIVSPDGPSAAKEHFEHEAVGQVVMQVLEKMLREQPEELPLRYLRIVDPMQQGVYSRFAEFDVLRPVWPFAESPRSVQNRALKAHKSQIDARIVGLEYTPLFESEYYQVRELDE